MPLRAASFRSETVFTAILTGFGMVIIAMSVQLGLGSMREPGPGFFPFFIGVLILVFGIPAVKKAGQDGGHEAALDAAGKRRFLAMFAAFCAWLIFMPWLGFVLVTFLASLAFARIMGLSGWLRPLALSLGIAAFIYLLFEVWFYVDLPRGILG